MQKSGEKKMSLMKYPYRLQKKRMYKKHLRVHCIFKLQCEHSFFWSYISKTDLLLRHGKKTKQCLACDDGSTFDVTSISDGAPFEFFNLWF